MRKRRIAITMGDPAGIGPEVIARAFQRPEVREMAEYIVLGNHRVLEETCAVLNVDSPFEVTRDRNTAFGPMPKLLETDNLRDAPIAPGTWSVRTGRASLSYILQATNFCLEKRADAIVTGPICKQAVNKAGCKYPGHTEFIADLAGAEKVVMMLIGGGLRVALVTTHAALAAVPQLATRGEIYATIIVTWRDLRESFGIEHPRIGVLGLNPHAGEGGMLGSEEERHIVPAIAAAKAEGAHSVGPIPADTAFHRMLQGEFDVLIAMYHDQGLGPLKTIAFDSGVNITLGMPIVRTSVDHGTAFNIVGQGKANDASMVVAIETAISMSVHRTVGARS